MNRHASRLAFAAIVIAGLANPLGGAQAVGLTNGSFETGPEVPLDPGFMTLGTGSTAIDGWVVDSGTIDYIRNYWEPADGNYSLDMDGASPGSIKQTLTGLVPTQQYKISFSLAGNPDGAPTEKTLGLSVGVNSATYSFDVTGKSSGDMGWVLAHFFFTPTGSTADLIFKSLTGGDFYGAALDNVSISETPLPAALPLFATALGGFGVFSWFRRRSTAST